MSFGHKIRQLFDKAQNTVDDNEGQVAIVVYGPNGQTRSFSHPSMDAVLNRHGYESPAPSPLALLDRAMFAINLQQLSLEQLIDLQNTLGQIRLLVQTEQEQRFGYIHNASD